MIGGDRHPRGASAAQRGSQGECRSLAGPRSPGFAKAVTENKRMRRQNAKVIPITPKARRAFGAPSRYETMTQLHSWHTMSLACLAGAQFLLQPGSFCCAQRRRQRFGIIDVAGVTGPGIDGV